MATAVGARDLTVRYDRVLALDRVNLTLEEGQALGIVGPNGSGKSTLLKVVAGLIAPASGSIHVFGGAPRSQPPGAASRSLLVAPSRRAALLAATGA